MLGCSVDELESDEFEAALLEAPDDVSDETALDAVRLMTVLFQSMITKRADDLIETRVAP